MAETLAQRAARLYDENGPSTASFMWNKQLREGTRKLDDEMDDLWRAAIAEATARDWRSIHKPYADELSKKARELFIAHFSKEQ